MKIWIISDTHFCHKNIIAYSGRPFKTVEEMNDEIIKRWNNKVGKDDFVIHLGDFALGKKDDELLKIALELEKIALNDDYFVKKKLYPNIDFYSGITLSAMGFPSEMFVVLFAVARTAGWIAHWKEMYLDPLNKLNRPRQLYIGKNKREFVELNKR